MGASLTSPLPHRPPSSVSNHLFVAPDAPSIFQHHTLTTIQAKKQSVFAAGWNWSKKAAQQLQQARCTLPILDILWNVELS
ncbi:hypothetical protein X798_06298 [Onchocerca flexuosa]|uniref:Uncharacterized protein n=2 Tax=Onchocerca flexuosa TaxID=387005 RepID=A0A183HF15_9BILA|nr:hypothetical protein X798_06298 [Onchocerca flexuosa]VDO45314.1 unnamed protein product [Onchocerca flexuosa]